MQFLPETLIATVILLSVILYFINKRPLYSKKKNILLSAFKDVRAKSLNLQDAMTKHIMDLDASDEEFTHSLTYGQALKQLQKDHIAYLSGKRQTRIRATNNLLKLYKTESILKKLESSLNETEKILAHKKSTVQSA